MHSFGFYFKKGAELTKMILKKKTFLEKVMLALYFIASVLGKLFIFTRPIFMVGDANIGLMVNEGHDLELTKIFEGLNDRKRYTSLLLSSLYIDFLVLGIVLVCVTPFIVWQWMCVDTAQYIGVEIALWSMVAFAVVVFILLEIALTPRGFVAAKGLDLTAGDILFLAKKASRGNRGMIFGLIILKYLFVYLIMGALGGGIFFVHIMASGGGDGYQIYAYIELGLLFLIAVFEIFVVYYFKLTLHVSLYALYTDAIDVKHVVVAKRNASTFNDYVALFSDDKEEK